MTQSIDSALVTEFSGMVHNLAAQMESRLRGKVIETKVTGEDKAVERLGEVEAIEITTRHAGTVAQDIAHSRRQLKLREFRTTLLLDEKDDLETLIDPSSQYAQAVARSMMRVYDQIGFAALEADVKTGKDFGTTVSFANDDGITIAHGSTGLTYDKLLQAQENFINNNVGVDSDAKLYLAVTGQQNTNMMQEEELTSGDFNRANDFIREKGRIVQAAGFEVMHFSGTQSPIILPKTSTTRTCYAFANDAIEVGLHKDISITVDKRPDLNNAKQIQACMYIGATRVDGKKVQIIQATET